MLIALLVCLIPTTIGGLLSAIGIAGIDRLLQKNVLAMSGRAVEAAGDVDTLLLDKTGTITLGNRQATEFLPAPGVAMEQLVRAADLASRADETPEGRSIVALARRFGATEESDGAEWTFVPFTAETRMSGVDRAGDSIRKGAGDSVAKWCGGQDATTRCPPRSRRRSRPSPAAAARRCSSRRTTSFSERSTSRTSSSPASPSASPSCGRWACAP